MKYIGIIAAGLILASTAAHAHDPRDPGGSGGTAVAAQGQVQHQYQAQGQQQTSISRGGRGGAGGAGGTGIGNGGTGNGGSSNSSTSINSYANGSPWANPAASAVAPSLYLSSICQSGFSAAGQAPVFGISLGITWSKEFCLAAMKADYFRKNGNEPMAHYFECQLPEIRDAYKATGTPCAADRPREAAGTAANPAPQPQRTAEAIPAGCHKVAGTNALTCD